MIESKRHQSRFTCTFAQKVFTLDKMDLLKHFDERLIEMFKINISPYESQIRNELVHMVYHYLKKIT